MDWLNSSHLGNAKLCRQEQALYHTNNHSRYIISAWRLFFPQGETAVMKKFLKKLRISTVLSFFFGVTTAYFIWLTWDKLTEYVGNTWKTYTIIGIVVVLGIWLNYVSIKKIMDGVRG